MKMEIFEYYQRTARERGWPPTPIELAQIFDMTMTEIVEECLEVHKHLRELTRTIEIPRQEANLEVQMPSLTPDSEKKPEALEIFTGRNGWPNPHDRAIYCYASRTNVYHRDTVDYMFHDEMIAIVPETEKYLYGAETCLLPVYRPGSRPFLEEIVEETTRGCKTDRAKAMALVRLIGNPESSPYRRTDMKWERFLGGTEEEVIKKGWRMCNEISRALSFLCQIAGLPARPVFFFSDPVYLVQGHAQTEIFFDGKWNLVEQNSGLLYLKADGYFASTVELRDDPSIINARTDVGGTLALCSSCFRGPSSIIPYCIDDVSRYKYLWQDMKYPKYM